MLPFDKLRVNIAACGGDFGINPVGFSLNCGKLRKNLKNIVEQGTDFGRNILIHAADFCSARNVDSAFIGLLVYFSFYYPLKNKYGHFVEEISWSQLYKTSGVYGNTPIWFLFSFFCMYVVAHFTE